MAEAFVITRTFDAPRDLVFRVWTDAEHLQHWWGPKGMKVVHCTNDLRPGGAMHYGLQGPDGSMMWGRWIFTEVVPPERLAFITSFSDEEGGVTRAPFFDGGWPLEVHSTITFTESAGRTTLTMVGVPIRATDAERAMFRSAHPSMQGGWSGTLDQLTTYLENQS
ncbi:MAG TPA: SRPBCC domain-containing protein [Thermoanaerobaculia bacterium]|nr:SRPBCC domain-containing protein [Thermoanaerobaculia bacterium]